MKEKEVIAKIQQLKQVKPRENWVISTKQRILEEGQKPSFFSLDELILGLKLMFGHKLALASVVMLLVMVGTFGFAQKSVPGDMLFSVKKAGEKGVSFFETNRLERDFNITNKRLAELSRIVEQNDVNSLAPAINEYQASVSETAKAVQEEVGRNPEATEKIVGEIKSLAEKTQEVRSLGVEMPENEELNTALAEMLKAQVKDLENRSLREEDISTLEEIKADIEQGNYTEALEKLLSI